MQYLVLIYSEDGPNPTPPTPEQMKGWFDYTKALKDAGVFMSGEALLPTSTATTIRGMGADAVMTDGPFAETKETLGGFYMIDCADADEALKWAGLCPGASYGSIELRPVVQFS
ncbi:MAG: hypothetical protein ACJAZO_004287 [Myxococcota bacterium]|jgi:hypothetical protein